MTEGDILTFARNNFRSVRSIELLILLKRDSTKSWRLDEVVRELRSSMLAMRDAMACLQVAELVAEVSKETYLYRPRTRALGDLADSFQLLYARKPTAVLSAIFEAPNDRLRNFANAFKLKE
jgi:hypothetical protein